MVIIGLLLLTTLAAAAAGFSAEDRVHMKRVDVSPARPDRGDDANADDLRRQDGWR